MTVIHKRAAELAAMDLDAVVHRVADINAAIALLDFSRKNRDRLAALADERRELWAEIERRAAILWAKLAADNAAAAA